MFMGFSSRHVEPSLLWTVKGPGRIQNVGFFRKAIIVVVWD
jgi:hypothetical protein